MKFNKPLLIVLGEPNSTFVEILSKALNKGTVKKRINYPIVLIGSKTLILSQLKFLNKNLNFQTIDKIFNNSINLKKKIYIIDVKYNFKKPFEPISKKSKKYIANCFKIALELLNNNVSDMLINGPISKKHFLDKKYPGITEYIFFKSKVKVSKKPVMLIYNKNLSVSPVTTHIPLKDVSKNININNILHNVIAIHNFYKKNLNINPKIALLGLNPHCESKSKLNEEKKIIIPAIKKVSKKNINVSGPYSADTFFIKKNINNYNSVIGLYHDQVLTPFKTLYEFNASNITLGLPFLRMSVDHGPNETMLGKNKSNTESLENIFDFIYSTK